MQISFYEIKNIYRPEGFLRGNSVLYIFSRDVFTISCTFAVPLSPTQ